MTRPKGNDPRFVRRILAVILTVTAVILFFGYALTGKPPHWAFDPASNVHFTVLVLFCERLAYLVAAAAVSFAAFSAGLLIMRLLRLSGLRAVETACLALAFGLGALSLVTLVAGLAGFLRQPVAIGVLFILAASGLGQLRAFALRLCGGGGFSAVEKALCAVVISAAALILVYAFSPPMYFDALEYHLGAPAHYFRTGAIRYIRFNVYSNFPSNSEMLYLFSMTVTGSKFTGAMLGKVLNAFIALAAAGAAFSLGRWLFSRAAGIFAAAALLVSGGFFQVATAVYVEPLQTLYVLLAVLAVGRFLAKGSRAALLAGGAAAGLAMGVKYPSAVFVAAPLALAVLLRGDTAARRAKSLALFIVASLAPAAPWLLKNLVFTGNPVYPLLYSLFGGRDWSALQDARWALAHTGEGGLAWQQWTRHVAGLFFANELVCVLAFAFVPLLLARGRMRRALYALAFSALYIFLWFALTHRVDRFAVPAFAVMGAVSGAGLFSLSAGRLRRALSVLAVVLAAVNLFYLAALYGHVSGLDPSVPLFGKYDEFLTDKKAGYDAWMRVNELLPRGSKVLLWAEAETFYLDFDHEETTVFDRKPLEEIVLEKKDLPAVAAELRAGGFEYIFANWATFRRQQETYRFTSGGEGHEGYSDVVTHEFFAGMERGGFLQTAWSAGPDVYPATPAYVLYRVR